MENKKVDINKCLGCGQYFEDLYLVDEIQDEMPFCDGCIKTMEP